MLQFDPLIHKLYEEADLEVPSKDAYVLAIDPGETTGIALFKGTVLDDSYQIKTPDIRQGAKHIFDMLSEINNEFPLTVVIEEYRIYGSKAMQHIGSNLHTPKLIGYIEGCCVMLGLPYKFQMAQQAKQFCTDDKLAHWGFYKKGEQHARDAIRHACAYLLFTKIKDSKKKS